MDAKRSCPAGDPCDLLSLLHDPHRMGCRLVMILRSHHQWSAATIAERWAAGALGTCLKAMTMKVPGAMTLTGTAPDRAVTLADDRAGPAAMAAGDRSRREPLLSAGGGRRTRQPVVQDLVAPGRPQGEKT